MRQRGGRVRRRRGRVPFGLALLLAVIAGLVAARRIVGAPEAQALISVDTCRSAIEVDADADWVDPRWADELALLLAELPAFPADDRAGVLAVADEVATLPFVAEVFEPRVVWPDGVELDVRLRRPAACVWIGESFYAIAEDGVVLPGSYPAPPWIGHGYLPVIGPNDRSFDEFLAGDALVEERHLDALSGAIWMRAAFRADVFEVMGPPLIDATRARLTSVREPGVIIDLEGARRVWFGRAPWSDEPGELPVRMKWDSLARAVAELARGTDWDRLDVRWDDPDVRLRDAQTASGDPAAWTTWHLREG